MLMMLGVCVGAREKSFQLVLMMLGVCAGGSGEEFPADAHDAGCLCWRLGFQLMLMMLGVCPGG